MAKEVVFSNLGRVFC